MNTNNYTRMLRTAAEWLVAHDTDLVDWEDSPATVIAAAYPRPTADMFLVCLVLESRGHGVLSAEAVNFGFAANTAEVLGEDIITNVDVTHACGVEWRMMRTFFQALITVTPDDFAAVEADWRSDKKKLRRLHAELMRRIAAVGGAHRIDAFTGVYEELMLRSPGGGYDDAVGVLVAADTNSAQAFGSAVELALTVWVASVLGVLTRDEADLGMRPWTAMYKGLVPARP